MPDAKPLLAGVHVLFVDDLADVRALFSLALEQCGATVTAVASVAEALAVLKQCKPDVLVSDIAMPGQDGYVLIRALRAAEGEHGRRIPAVALTGFTRPEDCQQALSAGFQVHVPKPVEPDRLVAIIADLVGRSATPD